MKRCLIALLFGLIIVVSVVSVSAQERNYSNGHVNWSPDGKKIAFASDRSGDMEIYVMNRDGSNAVRLTDAPGRDAHPAFSPDGKRIAFQSPRAGSGKDTNIYLMNADGSKQTRITNLKGFAGVPCWSPDGRKILFQFEADSDGDNKRWHIYVMNADGSNMVRLTNDSANNQVPRWSPDGSRILYFSDITGKNQLYLMKPDGSGKTRLTDNSYDDGAAAWSPDGKRIVFQSVRNGHREIYVMNADGSNQTQLTNGVNAFEVVWSPDGRKLLFTNMERGKTDIFMMDPDGTNMVRVIRTQAVDLEREKEELLKLHRKDRRAHFETDAESLLSDQPEEGLISVRNGKISQTKRTDTRKMFEAYFKDAKYYEWDDLEPPIIRISNDASMAWMIVRLRVRRTQADKEEKFVYSGIMTYEKRDGRWIKIANVSTFE
ncbi:MAG: DPP IV N-terminal domain-containing protein [Blastocatellia bacterium]|nr:DPP IV N-terminal domain-containing protein [Blastocatellia bacterium]